MTLPDHYWKKTEPGPWDPDGPKIDPERKLDVEDLRRLGLLGIAEPSSRRTVRDVSLVELEKLPQARRDAIVRNLLLNVKTAGKIQVDGKTLDLETEARELALE